jgi:hypothetical protein
MLMHSRKAGGKAWFSFRNGIRQVISAWLSAFEYPGMLDGCQTALSSRTWVTAEVGTDNAGVEAKRIIWLPILILRLNNL